MPKGIWRDQSRNWKQGELEILKANYGFETPEQITHMVNVWRENYGLKHRTVTAIQVKAKRLKLSAEFDNADGQVSTAQVIQNTGHRSKVYEYLRNRRTREAGLIRVKGKARHRFITIEQAEKLDQIFPPIPKGYIKTRDAANRLGFTTRHISQLARTKVIPSIKHGHTYYISGKLVDLAEKEMRSTGTIRLKWRPLVAQLTEMTPA